MLLRGHKGTSVCLSVWVAASHNRDIIIEPANQKYALETLKAKLWPVSFAHVSWLQADTEELDSLPDCDWFNSQHKQ